MPLNPELRRTAIGGSEVGAVLNLDEFNDAFGVWARKKGGLPYEPSNPAQIVGKCLEPGILMLYEHVTGREVEYVNESALHPARPFQAYTIDARCANERRGIEVKVATGPRRWLYGQTADETPLSNQLQCWWYQSALEYDVWDLVVYTGDGMPRIYTVERDLEAERAMLDRVEEFWRRYIVGDERPPITGGEIAGRWLQYQFREHRRPDMRPATEEEEQLLNQYEKVRIEQVRLNAEATRLAHQLQLAIGNREGLLWPGGKLTWRKSKDSEVVAWESCARGLLNRLKQTDPGYMIGALISMYTTPKPGTRRMLLQTEALKEARAEGE